MFRNNAVTYDVWDNVSDCQIKYVKSHGHVINSGTILPGNNFNLMLFLRRLCGPRTLRLSWLRPCLNSEYSLLFLASRNCIGEHATQPIRPQIKCWRYRWSAL